MDLDNVKQKMASAFQVVQEDIATIRVGKATPSLVEDIIVPAYGNTQQLKIMELASIQAPEPHSLSVNPWDKTVISEIAKAINTSDLGLNAVIDGEIIRIQVPPITEERRAELIKILGTKIESGKVQLRNIRHNKINDLKKQHEAKEINEDEKFNLEKELQTMLDGFVADIEELGKNKEEELKKV